MSESLTDSKIKELIAKPENRIELHDLVDKETEKLLAVIQAFKPPMQGEEALAAVKTWVKEIEEKSTTLVKVFAYGCYFGTPEHAYLWKKSLERLASNRTIDRLIHKVQLYPVMLIAYAGGVSATAAGNVHSLKSLLSSRISYEHHENTVALAYEINGWLLSPQEGNQILELENRKTPLSDHVFEVLQKVYPQSLLRDAALEAIYDKWDILLCMTVAFHTQQDRGNLWTPVGRFSWTRNGQLEVIKAELASDQSTWPLVASGMFNQDIKEAEAAFEAIQQAAKSRF